MSTGGGFEDILAEAAPRRTTVRILLRQDLLARHHDLEQQAAAELEIDARENREPLAPALARQITDLEAEIDAAKRSFTFEALGRRAWTDLLAKHPPTRDEVKANKNAQFNAATFPVAAIAAASVDPKMTEDQVRQLEDLLPVTEFESLWVGALEANLGGSATPKSLVAGTILRTSVGSATTAALEGSLAASS